MLKTLIKNVLSSLYSIQVSQAQKARPLLKIALAGQEEGSEIWALIRAFRHFPAPQVQLVHNGLVHIHLCKSSCSRSAVYALLPSAASESRMSCDHTFYNTNANDDDDDHVVCANKLLRHAETPCLGDVNVLILIIF